MADFTIHESFVICSFKQSLKCPGFADVQEGSVLFNGGKLIREREGEQEVDAVCPGVCLEQLGTHREQGEKTEISV